MKMLAEPSSASSKESKPEPFGPPGITSLATLTDGREPADFRTRYGSAAWVQIGFELIYLLLVLATSFIGLALLAIYAVQRPTSGFVFNLFGPYPASATLVAWASITLGGACGGCTFALKWLYHTIAKQQWHADRVVWRIVVPISSAMLAIFSGLMILSGLVPFLARAPLSVPTTGAAYGFFVGVFSDNVLAALQRLANNIFGTMDKRGGHGASKGETPTPDDGG
jgi:hypothetical protein